jgi:anti-sigma B factor antagonist
MIKPLETKVRYQPKGVIIDLQGELTLLAGEALNQAYTKAESYNPEVVLLNFSGVNYINSAGIALMIGLLIRVRQAHRSLVAFGLNAHYEKIFELSRLTEFIQMRPSDSSMMMQ